MSASPTRRLALGLGLVLLAACRREIEVRPFSIQALADTGASLVDLNGDGVIALSGTCHRISATHLEVNGTTWGTVALSFDGAAAPAVAFPSGLDGQPVVVQLNLQPNGRGPNGPLTIPGLRIDQGGQVRFLMAEDTALAAHGPVIPAPVGPQDDADLLQLPAFEFVAPGLYFEPGACGDAYYDALRVAGTNGVFVLDAGDLATVGVDDPGGLPDWVVLHVLSFHRLGYQGGGVKPPAGCSADKMAWAQLAAWR